MILLPSLTRLKRLSEDEDTHSRLSSRHSRFFNRLLCLPEMRECPCRQLGEAGVCVCVCVCV